MRQLVQIDKNLNVEIYGELSQYTLDSVQVFHFRSHPLELVDEADVSP